MKIYTLLITLFVLWGKVHTQSCPANLNQVLLKLQGCELPAGFVQLPDGNIKINYVPKIAQITPQNVVTLITLLRNLQKQTANPQNQQVIQLLLTELTKQQTTGNYNNNYLQPLLTLIKSIQENPSQPAPSYVITVIESQIKPTTPAPPQISSVTITKIDAQSVPQLITFLTQMKNSQSNPQVQQYIQQVISVLQSQQTTGNYNNNVLQYLINFITTLQSQPNNSSQLQLLVSQIQNPPETKTTVTTSTLAISTIDANTVPQIIQFLNQLKTGQSAQNQEAIQLVIGALQQQQSTGKYDNSILKTLIQLIQSLQSNPSGSVSVQAQQIVSASAAHTQ